MIILDTNVLSELMKVASNSAVLDWIGAQSTAELFTTTITQAEVYYGLALLPIGKRRSQLEKAVNQVFEQDFERRILVFDRHAAYEYGGIVAHRKQLGKPIAYADAQIAAIARAHNADVATRNILDFSDCQLILINPWQFDLSYDNF